MNERIRDLAEQAGATFIKGYIELSDGQLMLSDGADVDHTNMDLAKFAELIVRECVMICAKQAWESRTNDDWTEYNALSRVSGQIKQHFGVEK